MSTPRLNSNKDILVLIDLDRTLLDTVLIFNILNRILLEQGYANGNELNNVRKKIELSGGSFDLFGYIRSFLLESEYSNVVRLFREATLELDLFNSGARDFIHFLNECSVGYGILTFGSDISQREKIRAAKLEDIPVLIISKKGKGRVISNWYHHDTASFMAPSALGGGSYRHIILVDDKMTELQDLPYAATGFLYQPSSDTPPLSQEGNGGGMSNIYGVRSFIEIRKFIDTV